MPAGAGARAAVLRYWHAVEMFGAQAAPRPDGDGRVVELAPGVPPPWDPGAPARTAIGEDRVWRHAVHCGLFSLDEAYGRLARVFPPTDDDRFGAATAGESALAAFVVDDAGYPVEGSLVLSECAWAIGRVLADGGGSDIVSGFGQAQMEAAAELGEMAGGPLTAGHLHDMARWAHAAVGLADAVALGGVRVRSYHVDRATARAGGDGVLLNSFIARDLRSVAAAVRRGDAGHALWRYLAPDDEVDPAARHDVERDRDAVEDALAVDRVPAGRWPAPLAEPLATGQQMAVNEALRGLGHGGGVLAVNGPPGTGKTTMLRGIVAAAVTERARHLADLARPEDAFEGIVPWGRESSGRRVWRWRPRLAGWEMVLACSTNAAAENVTTEIPGVDAIGAEWAGEADHMAALATLVLHASHRSAGWAGARRRAAPPAAWGMVAACLGSRRRGVDFAGAFWWGRLPRDRGDAGGAQMAMEMPGAERAQGLHRALRSAVAGDAPEGEWEAAVAAFRAADDAEAACRRAAEERAATGDDRWGDRRRRLEVAPHLDPEWDAARTRLFLAALALHRALLTCAPESMLENLRAAMDLVAGRPPAALTREAAVEAWRSLFMVVPVVSTTFASLPRLFADLGREDLGWLLIDEAGQAAPQQAVGALWRARRAVVVGDPRQLEPIVALPRGTQDGLRDAHGVGARWVPGATSAQRLADRVSRLGTHDGTDGEDLWVGAPLTLHRRCEEPMFGIVNAMAYGGRMINGTPARGASALPPSAWLDVPGDPAEGHWVPAQGERLDGVLAYLDHRGHDLSQVLVVSPFRDVARALRVHARRWPGIATGTVHTAQGREADTVILVLGGEPAGDGARRWATRRPNLLNVAVSRARRRLWVIGDREAWARHRHADAIAARLPAKG